MVYRRNKRSQRSAPRVAAPGTIAAFFAAPRMRRFAMVVGAGLTLFTYGSSSADVWQGPGPVAECEDYAAALRACFGEKRAQPLVSSVLVRSATRSPAERAGLATECSASATRVRRTCQ
jgi:hypothetical protein